MWLLDIEVEPHCCLSGFMGIATLPVLLLILGLVQLRLKTELYHYGFVFVINILSKLDDQRVEHYWETHLSLD